MVESVKAIAKNAKSKLKENARSKQREYESDFRNQVEDIRDSLVKTSENLARRAGAWASSAEERVSEARDDVEDFIREKPLQSLAIGFAAGVLATLILGRR